MTYVDGFVTPVPTANKEAYRVFSETCAEVYKDFGALALVEAWGDDVPDGEVTSMPIAVQLKPEETVVFSWVLWPDKATRDAGLEKIFADPRMTALDGHMPLDGKRMIFGGFTALVEA